MRSVQEEVYIEDRPATDLSFGKISNGHLRKESTDPLHDWC